MKKSQIQVKLELTIETLSNKENKTTNDLVRLTNAKLKLEDKSLSKVYKNLTKNVSEELKPLIKQILGKAKMPTFEEFKNEMPEKYSYSNFSGLQCLARFNKSAMQAAKVEQQGGTILKAA